MGTGYHGGFGLTRGFLKKVFFTPVRYEGCVKVDGIERDVSRKVYQRSDIDFTYIDKDTGQSNLERMLKGRAPYSNDGSLIELHHILQTESGTMVEIRETTHRKYKRILHGLLGDGDSFRNNPILKKQFNNFRRVYWQWRAKQYMEGNYE